MSHAIVKKRHPAPSKPARRPRLGPQAATPWGSSTQSTDAGVRSPELTPPTGAPNQPVEHNADHPVLDISPKLVVGAPNDPLEREADSIADRVMRMRRPANPPVSTLANLSSTVVPAESQRLLHRKRSTHSMATGVHGMPVSDNFSKQIRSQVRSSGRPLDGSARQFLEPRLGAELSQVRVHSNTASGSLAKQINARAFTVGPNIFFAPGELRPSVPTGARLLAHEVAHTLQRPRASTSAPPTVRREPSSSAQAAGTGEAAESSNDEGTGQCQSITPSPGAWKDDEILAAIRADAPGANNKLMSRGAHGPAVSLVQQALVSWGCANGVDLLPKYGADGSFGRETEDAVQQFQLSRGGGADGIVGPLTMFHLDQVVLGEPLPGAAGLIVDDQFEGTMGDERRMYKREFVALVESEACSVARQMLADTQYSFEDCDALFAFLEFLDAMPASEIEQVIIQGTAGIGAMALTARALVDAVLEQVRNSIHRFLAGEDSIGTILEDLGAPPFIIDFTDKDLSSADGGLRKKAGEAGGGQNLSPARVQQSIRGEGRPLDGGIRSRMEGAMGTNFNDVRIHTGAKAAKAASRMHARAFTVGSDIGFAPGEYQPGSLVGDALIAHELAHVSQQQGATEVAHDPSADAAIERAADDSALAAMLRLGGRIFDGVKGLFGDPAPRMKSRLRLSRCACGSEDVKDVKATCPVGDPNKVKKFKMGVFQLQGNRIGDVEKQVEGANEIWRNAANMEFVPTIHPPLDKEESCGILDAEHWGGCGNYDRLDIEVPGRRTERTDQMKATDDWIYDYTKGVRTDFDVLFVRTVMYGGYTGVASRLIWISTAKCQTGWTLAHEISHLMLKYAHHDESDSPLMRNWKDCKSDNTSLTNEDCIKARSGIK